MFFVIFDLEAVFLFAWAVTARSLGWPAFWEVVIFIGILVAAWLSTSMPATKSNTSAKYTPRGHMYG
jgi:NADH-ubiquinone/plastoquinone oxidoreductase, chain 3